MFGNKFSGPILPYNSNDPTHISGYGKGGIHTSVDTLADRNAIPVSKREHGMIVAVGNNSTSGGVFANYQLIVSNWYSLNDSDRITALSNNSNWSSITFPISIINNTSGYTVANFETTQLYGTNGTNNLSLDWNTRTLNNTSGTAIADYGTSNFRVYNTPIGSTDAANKAYVDTKASASLAAGKIYIGNGSGVATAQTLSGDITVSNSGVVTASTTAIIGKLLTGYASGSGIVSASDSIKSAIQKLDGNIQDINALPASPNGDGSYSFDSNVVYFDNTYQNHLEFGVEGHLSYETNVSDVDEDTLSSSQFIVSDFLSYLKSNYVNGKSSQMIFDENGLYVNDGAIRLPNLTTTQKNALSPVYAGMMVYDTTLNKIYVNSGTSWDIPDSFYAGTNGITIDNTSKLISINSSVIPFLSNNNVFNGTNSFTYLKNTSGYVVADFVTNNLNTNLGIKSIDITNRTLNNSSGIVLDYANTALYTKNQVYKTLDWDLAMGLDKFPLDANRTTGWSIGWNARSLYDYNNNRIALVWSTRVLYDAQAGNIKSQDWSQRIFYSTSGTAIADYSTANFRVYNAPVGSTDVANKLYVDNRTTATAPLLVSTSGVVSMPVATASTNGYLSSTDWNTFNNKQNTLPNASSSTSGILTNTDWNTFNTSIKRIISNIGIDTTAGNALYTDYIYIATAVVQLTLPTAVNNSNVYTFKNGFTSNCTVVFSSGENADGSTSIIVTPNQSLNFVSDNSNYKII